jgi:hypothetical protein
MNIKSCYIKIKATDLATDEIVAEDPQGKAKHYAIKFTYKDSTGIMVNNFIDPK